MTKDHLDAVTTASAFRKSGHGDTPAYEEVLSRKIETARAQETAGVYSSNDKVGAEAETPIVEMPPEASEEEAMRRVDELIERRVREVDAAMQQVATRFAWPGRATLRIAGKFEPG